MTFLKVDENVFAYNLSVFPLVGAVSAAVGVKHGEGGCSAGA